LIDYFVKPNITTYKKLRSAPGTDNRSAYDHAIGL